MPILRVPRLCTYTIKFDAGFAPNPFWGYCTLAACTPNHTGVKLEKGDWIVGHQTAKIGQGLVYAMKVSDILDLDEYYDDNRFARKKPRHDGTGKERCGDNIYHREKRRWVQDQPAIHGPEEKRKDTKYAKVFVSRHYYYFGANADKEFPKRFTMLLWSRQGCKCQHHPMLVGRFLNWLESTHKPGIHGRPGGWETEGDSPACGLTRTRC